MSVRVTTVGDLLERIDLLEGELWDILEAANLEDYLCPKTRRRWQKMLEQECCICRQRMDRKPKEGMCADCYERHLELQQEIAEGDLP